MLIQISRCKYEKEKDKKTGKPGKIKGF